MFKPKMGEPRVEIDPAKMAEVDKTDALDELGEDSVENARRMVPVKTGALRDSIDYKSDDQNLVVYADTDYAADVEMGTKERTPKPYLRPGLESAVAAKK